MDNQERPNKMAWSSSVELKHGGQLSASNADLFNNQRRLSEIPVYLRNSLGLPDNGRGLTQEYYNVKEKLSNDTLVDLIIRRRSLKQDKINLAEIKSAPRKRSTLSQDLENKILNTLAWKEMEDELNKEDVVVQVKKKERQMRKEARKVAPQGQKRAMSSQAEERRAFLRTSLLVTSERRNTSDSIKTAIEEFKTKNKVQLVEVPENVVEAEEVKVSKEIIENPRILLERIKAATDKQTFGPQEEISELETVSRLTSKTDTTIHSNKKDIESMRSTRKASTSSVISGETDFSTMSKKHERSRTSRPGSSKRPSIVVSSFKRKKVSLAENNDFRDEISAAFSAKQKPGSASSSNGAPILIRSKRPSKIRRRSTGNSKLIPGVAMASRPTSRHSSSQKTPRSVVKPPSQK